MAKSVSLRTGRAFGDRYGGQRALRANTKRPRAEAGVFRRRASRYSCSLRRLLRQDRLEFAIASRILLPHADRQPGYTTRCYGVTFEDGTTGNFSMEKALRAIAAQPSRRSASPPA